MGLYSVIEYDVQSSKECVFSLVGITSYPVVDSMGAFCNNFDLH